MAALIMGLAYFLTKVFETELQARKVKVYFIYLSFHLENRDRDGLFFFFFFLFFLPLHPKTHCTLYSHFISQVCVCVYTNVHLLTPILNQLCVAAGMALQLPAIRWYGCIFILYVTDHPTTFSLCSSPSLAMSLCI